MCVCDDPLCKLFQNGKCSGDSAINILEEKKTTKKTSVRPDSLEQEIWTPNLPNKKEERQTLSHDTWYTEFSVWILYVGLFTWYINLVISTISASVSVAISEYTVQLLKNTNNVIMWLDSF
jgi:hypothetical protein